MEILKKITDLKKSIYSTNDLVDDLVSTFKSQKLQNKNHDFEHFKISILNI